MTIRNLLFVAIFAGFSIGGLAQPRLDLTEGTLYLEGNVILNYENIDFSSDRNELNLKTNIGGGYFVSDNFSIGIGIPGAWKFLSKNSAYVGLKISSTYFFGTDSPVFPYLGGNITPRYLFSRQWLELLGGIDFGVLASLSESVALDFGIRPQLSFKLNRSQDWKITIPAGFMGVRAVF